MCHCCETETIVRSEKANPRLEDGSMDKRDTRKSEQWRRFIDARQQRADKSEATTNRMLRRIVTAPSSPMDKRDKGKKSPSR